MLLGTMVAPDFLRHKPQTVLSPDLKLNVTFCINEPVTGDPPQAAVVHLQSIGFDHFFPGGVAQVLFRLMPTQPCRLDHPS